MSLRQLMQDRRPIWDHFRQTLDQAYKKGPRKLAEPQLLEIIHGYREISADLGRLRSLNADPILLDDVNRLVSRAHGFIYRSSTQKRDGIISFFTRKYPRLFRETWRYSAVSLIISALFCVLSFQLVQSNPGLISDVFGGGMDSEIYGSKSAGDIMDRFRKVPSPLLSTMVTTNNIRVAFFAFALGITFGIGTVYILAFNGVMLGAIAGAFSQSGMGIVLWRTVLIHGALELSAIVLAGGAGLLLGHALWCPGERTRRLALREESIRATMLVAGLVPAFIVAGFFEGFVTPSDAMSEPLKMGMGCVVAVCFFLYLLLTGRGDEAASTEGKELKPALA